MLTVEEEMARLVGRFQFAGLPMPNALSADGLDATDCTGISKGNADLADTCVWSPPVNPPERPPQVWPLNAEIDR